MKPAMLMAGITLMSSPALADQKAADGCAARLTKDAAVFSICRGVFARRQHA